MTDRWSDEEVARQYRLEVQQRFAAENDAYLRHERDEIATIKAQLDAEGKPHPDWLVERDSLLWEIYSGSEILIERNTVTVVAQQGYALRPDFVEMFDGTSVAWSVPSISALVVDGEPHVAIVLILVDYWDDDRHAAWIAEQAGAESHGEAPRVVTHDPTTSAIVDQVADRDRLRAEVRRLTEGIERSFEKGYDQAVQEIRDHFKGRADVAAEIDKIWKISLQRRAKIS